ncbi:addiction module protein [Polaromonas sp.]|uniref:addiction module protein n=1 Tax=Polaromonas sp. TaxID=1869339 RepID=UPI0035677E7F
MNAILKSLDHLSVEEKLQLVEDLWDDIAEQKSPVPATPFTRAEVLRRVAWRDAHPGPGKTLDQIILEAGVRL